MASKQDLAALHHAREHGIGRLLLLARRNFLSRLKRKMGDRSGAPFERASGMLLPFIGLDGTKTIELARRAGISKQAAAKAVAELEDAGLLTRQADPEDGRATLVLFTERGITYLLQMHAAIDDVERDYALELGQQTLDGLRDSLSRVINSGDSAEPHGRDITSPKKKRRPSHELA